MHILKQKSQQRWLRTFLHFSFLTSYFYLLLFYIVKVQVSSIELSAVFEKDCIFLTANIIPQGMLVLATELSDVLDEVSNKASLNKPNCLKV
jgi:hypothetical protein